ncbi:MAG: MarR family transcriptional regulator [Rhodobacteraceae bacterium]|nr:MarR family transcriptional regulator [Paracoccaceae bacterium]
MKPKDFDLNEFLPYLLNQAAEVSGRAFQRVYKDRYGMLRTEWRVLCHLGQFGPMTAHDIVRAAQSHKTKVSRAVAALEHKRFVVRETLQRDRRYASLQLSPAGRRVYADLTAIAQAYDAKVMARLEPSAAAALKDALRQLAREPI